MYESPEKFLQHLVDIDSNSRTAEGVNQVQSILEQFIGRLSFTSQRISHPQEVFGELLVARHAASKPEFTVSLLGHADTVRENEPSNRFSIEGEQINGPGVADDKGGLVVALWGLKMFLAENQPKFNIQFISSPSEELGSPGFTDRLKQLGAESQVCLGFEPALENGNIISSRHGNRWYDIEVTGKEAHSGRADGEEINAAHELALKIAELIKLKKKFPEGKINIGAIRSKRDNYNIVCGKVSAKLDIRFDSQKLCEDMHQKICEIVDSPFLTNNQGQPSVATFQLADDCPSFGGTNRSIPYLDKYKTIISEIEHQPCEYQHATGASDLNHMSHDQAVAIDGLGPVAGMLHTKQEYLIRRTLETRAKALCEFLTMMNSGEWLTV